MSVIYTLVSVLIVSLISLIAALPLLFWKKTPEHVLLILLSGSIGVLLGTVLLDFLPEIVEIGYSIATAWYILIGFFVIFVVESIVHWNHQHRSSAHGHGHAYHLAPINVIGDGVHNFIDGLVIAGAYSVNVVLGITATISVIFHEVPQEVADMGVLIYAGYSKRKAVLYNVGAGITAIIGAIVGLLLAGKLEWFTSFIIPFAAGNFIYIAASNLVPQLQGKKMADTLIHIFAIFVGFAVVTLITIYGPVHA